MPETENRTLEDIEQFFSDRKRKLTDIHIPGIEEWMQCNKEINGQMKTNNNLEN